MSREQAFLDLVSGRTRGPAAALARGGLGVLSLPYAATMRGRNLLYDRGFRPIVGLGRPTISVGNVTVGGTGKTPVIAHLARTLAAEGRRPAVLTRGYKAERGGKGDEHRLLEELLGDGVPVEADADRSVAADRVLQRRTDVDVFLLDDGFQHRRARRDFDLVLVDATRPFGHGRVLPRGLLREPLGGLRRASAVLVTRCDLVSHASFADTQRQIRMHSAAPIFRSRFAPGPLVDAKGQTVEPAGQRVVTLCGLGNPDAFEADVARRGLRLAEPLRFADHHPFTSTDVALHTSRLVHCDAEAFVTSGKDWVKLRPLWPADVPVWVAHQRVEMVDDDGWPRLRDMLLQATA